MNGDPVIPPPLEDDDDDVAWALQTAAVQWDRGALDEAVVWVRRAVDAAIAAGSANRIKELNRLVEVVKEAAAAAGGESADDAEEIEEIEEIDEVDEVDEARAPMASLSGEIPIDFDENAAPGSFPAPHKPNVRPPPPPRARPPRPPSASTPRPSPSTPPGTSPSTPPRPTPSTPPRPTSSLPPRPTSSLPPRPTPSAPPGTSSSTPAGATSSLPPRPAPSTPPSTSSSAPPGATSSLPPGRSSSLPPGGGSAPPPSIAEVEDPTDSIRRSLMESAPPPPLSDDEGEGASSLPDIPSASLVGEAPAEMPPAEESLPGPSGTPSSLPPPESDNVTTEMPVSASGISDLIDSAMESEPPMPSDLGSSPVSTELDFEDEDEDARGEEPPSMSAEAEEETTVEAPAVEAPESAPPLPPEAQTPTEGGAPEPPDEEAEETDAAPAGEEPSESEEPERAAIESVFLDEVRGFEDLPEEQQAELARDAELQPLSVEEEVGSFGAALVVRGAVGIMPAIADVAASIARPGDVVFTTGSLEDGIVLRVVALEDETLVASWKKETLDAAFAACPWVVDELREVADRFQALAGATLGDLGDRLDDSLRAAVTDRLQVRVLEAGDVIVEKGVAVPGLYVVGAGRLELVDGDEVVDELGPGDFVFPTEVTSAGAAPSSVRTGQGGALVLFASRTDAHELMLSVPPLLEILAG